MKIYLYKVNRNLNRCVRTCEAFGITKLYLINSPIIVKGNLFGAKNKVSIIQQNKFPNAVRLLALETYFKTPLWKIDFDNIDSIIIGGETAGLPKKINSESSP